jgi:hypothetical protein
MTKKLDKEHLEAITQLRDDFAKNANLIGSITIEEYALTEQQETVKLQKEQMIDQFRELRQKESELIELLKERYGDGSINIEDGTFTSID